MEIRTVANRLGHATASTTTNIYAHAIKSADEMAAEKLAGHIKSHEKKCKLRTVKTVLFLCKKYPIKDK